MDAFARVNSRQPTPASGVVQAAPRRRNDRVRYLSDIWL